MAASFALAVIPLGVPDDARVFDGIVRSFPFQVGVINSQAARVQFLDLTPPMREDAC